jgi:hypothetical protein
MNTMTGNASNILKTCKCGQMVIHVSERRCTFCLRKRKAHLILLIRKKKGGIKIAKDNCFSLDSRYANAVNY